MALQEQVPSERIEGFARLGPDAGGTSSSGGACGGQANNVDKDSVFNQREIIMRAALLILVPAIFVSASGTAYGQAFVGIPNSFSVDLSYTHGRAGELIETEGRSIDNVRVNTHAFSFSGTYVTPLEGLAVDAELPVVGGRVAGAPIPHEPEEGEWDDGDTHFALTDLRAGLRYQALDDPLAASIALSGTLPVTDYPTNGWVTPGDGLRALHGSVALARFFYPWVPEAYVHGSYEFSLVERVDVDEDTRDFGRNRSYLNFQAGYFVLDELNVHLAVAYQRTHGGMDFVDWDEMPDSVLEHHDQLLRQNSLHLGGGANYSITPSFSVGGAARFFAHGSNTLDSHLFLLSASYRYVL